MKLSVKNYNKFSFNYNKSNNYFLQILILIKKFLKRKNFIDYAQFY